MTRHSLQKWCTAPCHQVSPLIQCSLLIAETAHSYSRHFEGSLSSLWGFGLTLWLDGTDPCLFFCALFSSASPLYTHPTPYLHASQTGAVLHCLAVPLKSTHCSQGQHLDDDCSIKYDCIQSGLFCLWGSDHLETLDKICLLSFS